MPDQHIDRIYTQLEKIDEKVDKLDVMFHEMNVEFKAHCSASQSNGKMSTKSFLLAVGLGALLAYGGRGIDILVTWIGK